MSAPIDDHSELKTPLALRSQIINTSLEVMCSDGRLLTALGRRVNDAIHRVSPDNHIELAVGFDGIEYALPSGRQEISPDIAAEAAWEELTNRLQATLATHLQIGGLCIDRNGRRILVLGDEGEVLRSLAMYCLSEGLEVPSETGVCLRDDLATPYALPIEVGEQDLQRFFPRTCSSKGSLLGSVECQLRKKLPVLRGQHDEYGSKNRGQFLCRQSWVDWSIVLF